MSALGLLPGEPHVVQTASEAETLDHAAALASLLKPGDVVALRGDLGAGKTVFVRGAARALGVPHSAGVRSPSYAMVHTYEGGLCPLAHLDLYRIGDEDELEALGFRDLLNGPWIVMIEWPERAPSLEAIVTWQIDFEEIDRDLRAISFRARDREALQQLAEHSRTH